MTGSFDLQLVVMTEEMSRFRMVAHERIGSIPGVAEVHSALMTIVFHEGSAWKTGALAARSENVQALGRAPNSQLLGSILHAVLGVLERAGRAPAEHVDAAIGNRKAHARQNVCDLRQKGILKQL